MKQYLISTTKHAFVYSLGNILTKVIGLVLIPIYTNPQYLSHSDYGVLAVLEATVQILVAVLAMAMMSSLNRWFWDDSFRDKQKSIFFTTIAFLAAVVLPISLLLILFSENFSLLLFQSKDFSNLLKLVISAAAFQVINNQIISLIKLKSKSFLFVVVIACKLAIVLLGTIIGVVVFNYGLKAIWFSYLAGEVLMLVVLIPFVAKNLKFRFERVLLKEMLGYGIPLMLATVSGVILSVTDRYMVSSMSGLEDTGVYALGFRIANTLKIIVSSSIMFALAPLRMKKINDPNNKRFYTKTLKYTSFVFGTCLVALSLFSIEILKVFTSSAIYWKAELIIPVLGFALMFGLIKDNAVIGLTITKKTKILGILIFLTSIINIGLNIILIKLFDFYGASLATLISQLFLLVCIIVFSNRAYPIPYEWRNIIVLISVSILIILIGFCIRDWNLIIRLIFKIFLVLSYPFILFYLGFYDKVESDALKSILRNWSSISKLKDNLNRLFH